MEWEARGGWQGGAGGGRGVSESIKKGTFVMKIFFSGNVEWSFEGLWKMIASYMLIEKLGS